MKSLKIILAAALLGLTAGQAPRAVAAEDGKWFVLRNPNGSQCWTAVVIQVSGQYATGSALIAGGPYDSREKAEQRLADLAVRGTCQPS